MNKKSAHTKRASKQKDAQGNSLQPVKAVAWAVQNNAGEYVFCHWAEPDTRRLERKHKPSPEAKALPVWISFRDTMLNPRKATSVGRANEKV